MAEAAVSHLDWRKHKIGTSRRPCRHCDQKTVLRDADGKPSHKVCAERALQEQAAHAAAEYEQRSTS